MIKNELHALWHNKLLMVVLLVIILIPAMYAGFFLASMWDPYGDLKYLPVAVVNKDKAVTYNDKELTIGDDLAENLADNDSMAFNVVDEKTAEKGLKNGTYYMVITIPEDFSKNASTLMDDDPKQMVLDYKTNPGRNYISMKLSESAMKEIKENLTEEVTRTYAETVFDSLTTIEDGFQDAVDGTNDMLDGEDKLLDGNTTITDNLLVLSDGASELKAGTDTLASGLKTYTDGVSTVNAGVNGDLKSGVNQIAGSLPSIAQLNAGANSLSTSLPQYTAGVDKLYEGSSTLAGYNDALNGGVATLKAGNSSIKAGAITAITALGATPEQAVAAYKQYMASQGGTASGQGQTQLTTTTTTSVNTDAVDSINGMVSNAGTSLDSAKQNADSTVSNLANVTSNVNQAQTVLTSLLADESLTEEQRAALTNVNSLLGGTSSSLTTASGSAANTVTNLAAATDSLNGVSTDALTDAATQTVTVETKESQLVGAPNVQTAIVALGGIYAGASQIDAGLTGDGTISNPGLINSVKSYTSGVSELQTGAATLAANNTALKSGASQIAAGTDTLYTSLSAGAPQLVAGVNQLGAGTSELVKNNDTLLNGAGQLADGANQIADGSIQLADGSKELGDGLVTLKDGTTTLHDALADGKDEISENEASDATIDMFAEPVVTKETKLTEVENNGHAMAAYMFSVGIWVACLAFCLMYPLSKHTGELTNGKDWWASKAVVLYPMAILMVTMLMVILHFALGFEPASMPKTFIVALAAVACFMSIMYFFNLLLGKIGSFLMLLFMVLQLAGSAGTYPVEISGKLAQSLNKWMPFTYSVNGFRAGIAANGPSVVHECVVLFAISIVFTLLTVAVFRLRTVRIKQGKPFLYDWLEEKGLA